jgi:hypothetical protein
MPPDANIRTFDLNSFQNHIHVPVTKCTFLEEKRGGGRKLWIAFNHDDVMHSKSFHLDRTTIVNINSIFHFKETISKENKAIGFAFKKIDNLFLENVLHETAISIYGNSSSEDDHPDFLLLDTGHQKLWTDSAPKNAPLL